MKLWIWNQYQGTQEIRKFFGILPLVLDPQGGDEVTGVNINSKFDNGIFQLSFRWEAWGFTMSRHRLRSSVYFSKSSMYQELRTNSSTRFCCNPSTTFSFFSISCYISFLALSLNGEESHFKNRNILESGSSPKSNQLQSSAHTQPCPPCFV